MVPTKLQMVASLHRGIDEHRLGVIRRGQDARSVMMASTA